MWRAETTAYRVLSGEAGLHADLTLKISAHLNPGQHGPHPYTPEDCPRTSGFFSRHANDSPTHTLHPHPGLSLCKISLCREGGKVIKGLGLEKPFYFSSYWAGGKQIPLMSTMT